LQQCSCGYFIGKDGLNRERAKVCRREKEKTSTWLYRDFILAYFGKKVSDTQNAVDVNARFLLTQEGARLTEKQGKQETFCQ